ncbi:trypsin-like serine protease [Conidiobolus coronatus NRRL 28638]|uniref:Trypsin-like serine protease n=1 Tax=Conidiobolus coronatus (strain ATCC 28846 / CBS 209.66 / NRRL 28638) TaxID=796925 RepID=A0A137NUF1_CONC2|nr:trypsin-like serine protease [Conidiobolus coronatus NRRL 28638]|eukprot:KXN66352.1 trypsin-like serine protease [Conidiobolus coronatus NRRL 28638]
MSNTQIQNRIAGGNTVTTPFMYPFMVSLVYQGSPVCGGTLISPNKIMTAAHCTVHDIKDWTAMVHRHDLTKTSAQENGTTFKILKRRFHPNFNGTNDNNDVAVWTIFGKANTPYYPILDDGTQANKVGNLLNVIGWGSKSDGYGSTKLEQVKVPIVDNNTCQQDYLQPIYRPIDSELQLCAGYPDGGKDACTGDSGGPAFVMQESKAIIVGITSFGRGCALKNSPGVYTRVAGVKDWVASQVNN